METKALSMYQLKNAFYSLKSNKSRGYDDISYNVITKWFDSWIFKIFVQSLNWKEFFLDDLKIARATLIYKGEDNSDVSNYSQISVLPCFSKTLECMMYNRLYKYLIENNILYSKQFGF